MILGGGALWARSDRGLREPTSRDYSGVWMARRLLPVAISLPIVIGWLRWRGERIGLYETAFGLALFVMSNIVIFTIVIWLSARSLNRTDVERRQTEEVIRQTAAELQHTHAQLRLSEERLRLAVTGAGLGTWHWDLSTD